MDLKVLFRKKRFNPNNLEDTKLSRVLNLLDLTTLGVSCTLGSGIYVLAGNVIANYSGPSIILSFIIAGLCSFLAGFCYAELGSRVPRSGSAYIYIYVTIGEFVAFIIGWDIILEYIIGTSVTSSALSLYINSLANNQISNSLRAAMPLNVVGLASYPDFLAFGFSLLTTVLLVIGVKESSFLNAIFTTMNIAILSFILISGATKSDFNNWDLKTYPNLTWADSNGKNVTCLSSDRCGNGGFVPFGYSGIIKGSAKCFYAFIGFDSIATTGEEVLEPKKTIPISIMLTLVIVSICYISVSTILSLMIPYYILDQDTPITDAFNYANLEWAYYIVNIGAIISLITCLYSSMFPMPRIVYSMASDGLIFKPLAYVLPKLKTPVIACVVTGVLSAIIALIFDINQLIDMMSIGTLLAYILVSACTLILRYCPSETEETNEELLDNYYDKPIENNSILSLIFGHSNEPLIQRLFFPASTSCNKITSRLTSSIIVMQSIVMTVLCFLLNLIGFSMPSVTGIIVILIVIIFILTYIIFMQPTVQNIETFKVPFVPFFPLLSIFLNLYLITALNSTTWIRFTIWFIIGIIVYFAYGKRNSEENKKNSYETIIDNPKTELVESEQ